VEPDMIHSDVSALIGGHLLPDLCNKYRT